MLTWPIINLSGFFSLNFRPLVSFSEALLFKMSVVEIDPQSFVFKTCKLLCENLSPKFGCNSFWKKLYEKKFVVCAKSA